MTTTVLITGATGGIGRETALHLARRGFRVFATGRRQEAMDALRAEAGGLPLEVLALDVTDPESIEAARAEIERRTAGRGVDVLVNNAGYGQLGPVDSVPDAHLRAQYETNVFGLLAVTRAFVPAMRRRGAGRVINVSSMGGRFTLPFMGIYNSTKYAVESLSDALRMELSPFGVHVALIEPGYIRTSFTETSMGTLSAALDGSPYARFAEEADAILAKFEATAASPDVIARAIERAATSRRPRARYVAPLSTALAVALVALLPTRLVDWAIRKGMGIDRVGRDLQVAAST